MVNKEKWKFIKGFDKNYQVSSYGKIKTMNRPVYRKSGKIHYIVKEKILKCYLSTSGYIATSLRLNDKETKLYIHRIVASHFVPEIFGKTHVNHKDGNKLNNNADNLEWVTPKENIEHAIRSGLLNNKGHNHGLSKLTDREILFIRNDYPSLSNKEVALIYSIHYMHVSKIRNNKTWKHI